MTRTLRSAIVVTLAAALWALLGLVAWSLGRWLA